MKNYFIAAILAISVAGPAFAQQSAVNTCSSMANVAGSIMQKRQNGGDAGEMMKGVEEAIKISNGDQQIVATALLTQHYIIEAFSQPRYQSAEVIQMVVSEFSNETFIDCMEQAQ